MQPLHYDPFNRADGVLNTTAYPSEFGAASAGIVSNVVKFDNTGAHAWGFDFKVANYAVDLKVTIHSTDDQCGAVALMARYDRTANTHYGLIWGKAASTHPHDATFAIAADKVYLVKSTGSAVTSLATAVSKTFTSNRAWRMRIVVTGNLVQGYVDDLLVITAYDSTYSTPGTAAFGHIRKTSGGSTNLVNVDNLLVTPLGLQLGIMAAHDELNDLVKISIPSGGSPGMQQILNYHLRSGDWTIEDCPTTFLFDYIDDTGRKRVLYGSPTDGKVYQFDSTATRESAAFTGTWRSNWIQIDSQRKRRAVMRAIHWLIALAETNNLEATVEVTDDPDSPVTHTETFQVSGFGANHRHHVGQRGNFVRFGLTDAGSTSTMKIRRVELEVAS